MPKKYYAVKAGKETGIFETWDECKKNTSGFSGAVYKSFKTFKEAKEYLDGGDETCEEDFIKGDDEEYAIAYVDGSYDITSESFSYGVVLFYEGREVQMSKKFEKNSLSSMRNVAGEIMGARAAMQYCIENGISKLNIFHDYEGISRWCRGEWKATKEGTIDYVAFYNEIKSRLNVKFTKVKGHSGDKYNDLADKLAKNALGI